MKTYKYKMYSKAKDGVLDNIVDRFGILYNHCIALHRRYYKLTGKYIHKNVLMHHLVVLKHRKRWSNIFAGLDAQAVNQITDRIDRAYMLFFKNKKRHTKSSPPKFKVVKKYPSFTLRQSGYKFIGNKVRLNGRWYGFHKSRDWKGNVKRVTVKRDKCGDFWLFIVTDWVDSDILPKSGKSVGYDFGLKTFLIASDEKDIPAPYFFKNATNTNLKLSRAITRKILGGNNYHRSVLQWSRFMRHIANQRNDFHWKLANMLVKQYDILCFEQLNVEGMRRRIRPNGVKNGRRKFGAMIQEYGFAGFVRILEYLATKTGKKVRLVPWNFPSSQICSDCGFQDRAVKDLKIREWVCPKCGAHHDRDRNAAINILREGTSSRGRDTISPPAEKREASIARTHNPEVI